MKQERKKLATKTAMVDQIIAHQTKNRDLTEAQIQRIADDIKMVCERFKDGYDRAVMLDMSLCWGRVDAELVSLLHEE